MGRSTAKKRAEFEEKEALIQKYLNNIPPKTKKRKLTIDELIEITGARQWSHLWVRDPYDHKVRSANRERQIKDFVKWVFVKYSMPPFMYEAWPVPETEWDARERRRQARFRRSVAIPDPHKYAKKWFLTIASGGSLYKEHMKEFMTKKEVHLFLNSNYPGMIIDQHLWMAKLICMGADKEHATQITNTVIANREVSDKFWLDVARFFVVNNIRKDEMREILDCLVDVKKENEDFSMKGRTLQSIIRLSNNWHIDMTRKKACKNRVWEGYSIKDWAFEQIIKLPTGSKGRRSWKIEQITSEKRLVSEGNRMGHCVYSYVRDCITGNCAIFHVTCDETFENNSGLTIEVRNNGQIVQIKGKHNRSPRPHEEKVIKQWAQDNNLIYTNNNWW